MSKLVLLSHVGIHISNIAVTDYIIEILFKLMSQLLSMTLTFFKKKVNAVVNDCYFIIFFKLKS